jgi:hypothetical protein
MPRIGGSMEACTAPPEAAFPPQRIRRKSAAPFHPRISASVASSVDTQWLLHRDIPEEVSAQIASLHGQLSSWAAGSTNLAVVTSAPTSLPSDHFRDGRTPKDVILSAFTWPLSVARPTPPCRKTGRRFRRVAGWGERVIPR